jgi:two-component sensor histidine kinase
MAEGDEHVRRLEADNSRLRALLEEGRAPAELRHQVRNTLATLRIIIRRTAEIGMNHETFAQHLEGRLDCLLRVQSILMRGSLAGIDLYSLIANELLAWAMREGEQVTLTGPEIRLRPRPAELMALAFHELVTNSVKFGALGQTSGRLAVSWELVDGPDGRALRIIWQESGGSTVPPPLTRQGFGTEVLKSMLSYELGADTELAFEPGSLTCTIDLPLPEGTGSAGTLVESVER